MRHSERILLNFLRFISGNQRESFVPRFPFDDAMHDEATAVRQPTRAPRQIPRDIEFARKWLLQLSASGGEIELIVNRYDGPRAVRRPPESLLRKTATKADEKQTGQDAQ